jgi:hypothetical protein
MQGEIPCNPQKNILRILPRLRRDLAHPVSFFLGALYGENSSVLILQRNHNT